MEIDTLENIGKLNISDDKSDNNLSEDYINVENKESNIEENKSQSKEEDIYSDLNIKEEIRNKTKLPYICYVFFFEIFLFIITLVAYLIVISTYKENYTLNDNIYLKPKISEHNYSSITFDNNIKIILTQVNYNDTAGGAISFDKGYLDNEYKPGFLNLALLSLINNLTNDKNEIRYKLKNYMGTLDYSLDEYYSTFSFTILNNGFFDYLKYFAQLSYLNENDIRLGNENINSSLNNLKRPRNILNKRENHLLEFLIYGYKDKNGEDIYPEGIKSELKENLGDNYTLISDIMKDLYSSSSKIKIILFSRYKKSLVIKYILKYFNIVFKTLKKEETHNYVYNISNFETNKIIYYRISDHENNFIKINYYINNTNNNINQMNVDSGYLNYIKYILQETKEGSLYYELTHNNKSLGIKSLSSNIDMVLKNKILFSIYIELNRLSYNYLKEIISSVYEYIEKIKNYIFNLNEEDKRAKELYYINRQNFTFTEDPHDGNYYKKKSRELFYKDNYSYFLREVLLPYNFTRNLNNIKNYISKLTMNSSVVIIGINDYTKEKYSLKNTDISFIFKNISQTKYFHLNYSYNDLSKLNLSLNSSEDNITIVYKKNNFRSSYTYRNEVIIYDEDSYSYFDKKIEQICSVNNDTYKFFYLRDTRFGLPKLFITLYILHPFLRPNYTNPTENDELFFQFVIFISYLKSEINDKLSDAIRAGNTIKVEFNENYAYIDIICYSDLVEKILIIINDIISNSIEAIKEKFVIYRDYAIDYINSLGRSVDNKIRIEFLKYIYDDLPPYNYYMFSVDKFREKEFKIDQTLNSFLMNIYLYGYYSKEEALKICNLFINDKGDTFLSTLVRANLGNNTKEVNKYTFLHKLTNRKRMANNSVDKTFSREIRNGNAYLYKIFSDYNYKNSILAYVLKEIVEDIDPNITLEILKQRYIYLRIIYKKNMNYNSKNITKYLSEKIEKSNINDPVDIIGDRFYYILKNTQYVIAEKYEDLKTSALTKLLENIYERQFDPDKNIYFDIEFDKFKQYIIQFDHDLPNYIEFE